jgi:hypothetical protein
VNLDLKNLAKHRTMFHEYRQIADFDLEVIPYASIERGLQYEIFFRKYPVKNWHTEFYNNRPGSVLYLYPQYAQRLYDGAVKGLSYRDIFSYYEPIITESFEYLFPQVIKTLSRISELGDTSAGVFGETKLRKLK